MSNIVIINGLFAFIQQIILVAIARDFPMQLIVQASASERDQYQELLAATATCAQFSMQVVEKPDYSRANALLIGDLVPIDEAATPAEVLQGSLTTFRKLINDAMANSFSGNIVVLGRLDALFTFLAWRFSGLDRQKVLGLGTLPQSELLEQLLRKQLAVGKHDVKAFVLGTQAEHLIAWSRTSIGPAPVLTYVANQDTNFGTTEMTEDQQQVDSQAVAANQTLKVLALFRILQAFYQRQTFIGTVSNIQEIDDQTLGLASPVLIGPNGVKRLSDLMLADEEQQEYNEIAKIVRQNLDRIEAGEYEEKPHE